MNVEATDGSTADLPRVFLMEPEAIARTRRRVAAGDAALAPAMERLAGRAGEALSVTPPSVMDKTALPPSGDRHDYMSLGTYWWPNPDTPDGRPYVRRDGRRNPEGDSLDHPRLSAMVAACDDLALAAYLTGASRQAEAAARLLRVWFLDDATRMTPHLEYAQAIPGICDGRDIGIIDTATRLPYVVDAVGLLDAVGALAPAEMDGLRTWMDRYLQWLLDSPNGRGEAGQHNNHGTWYDVQLMALALFVGRRDVAERTAAGFGQRRIAAQIEPDGSQPFELARTRSLSYTTMNLVAFVRAATLAARVGVDLWTWRSADGRSLRGALDWLSPFAIGDSTWKWEQITPVDGDGLITLYRIAAVAFAEPAYDRISASHDGAERPHRVNLTHPGPEA
ncbi:MAG: alginate lyase family protein [Planctomycetes bacterium]|nr:alginate lyase family protein [Planctomycetota bacterium]